MSALGDKIKHELQALQKASRDKLLRAEVVVQWAHGHPQSALHSQIEWDDTKAAKEHRLWQVRRLIQVYVLDERGEPLMVNLTIDRSGGGGYRTIDDVVSDRTLSEVMFHDALIELERVQTRYERVQKLTAVWRAIRKVKRPGKRRAPATRKARQARQGKAR